MAKSVLSADRFHNEQAAFDYVEGQLWPNGPVCPHCGNADGRQDWAPERQNHPSRACASATPAASRSRSAWARFSRIATCRFACGFRPSTCFARPRKASATRQLQRTLGCGMKTAWHLGHRIRAMMTPADPGPLGGSGKTVEADETELAKSRKTKRPAGIRRARTILVLSLVERGGDTRSITLDHRGVWPSPAATCTRIAASLPTRRSTTSSRRSRRMKASTTPSSNGRGDVHTNTLEGFFSVLKRGLVGVYQHVDSKAP